MILSIHVLYYMCLLVYSSVVGRIHTLSAEHVNTSLHENLKLINLSATPTSESSKIKTVTLPIKRKYSGTKRDGTLIWKSNNAGLFSHFFQTKYLFEFATSLERNLIIAPYNDSTHAQDTVVLCDIFNFTTNISCSNRANISDGILCNKQFGSLIRGNVANKICFAGYVFGKTGIVSAADKLAVMNVQLRLRFSDSKIVIFKEIRNSFLSANKNMSNKNVTEQLKTSSALDAFNTIVAIDSEAIDYTESQFNLQNIPFHVHNYLVVHWRRGDQLTTRCTDKWTGVRDYSLNCLSVQKFIRSIHALVRALPVHLQSMKVLIATNENNSTTLSALRKQSNFHLLSDILHAYDTHHRIQSSTDEFVVEAQFMLDATILITFGISQINDVIENERMLAGKAYCTYSEQNPDVHDNWCNLYQKASMAERMQTLFKSSNFIASLNKTSSTTSSPRKPAADRRNGVNVSGNKTLSRQPSTAELKQLRDRLSMVGKSSSKSGGGSDRNKKRNDVGRDREKGIKQQASDFNDVTTSRAIDKRVSGGSKRDTMRASLKDRHSTRQYTHDYTAENTALPNTEYDTELLRPFSVHHHDIPDKSIKSKLLSDKMTPRDIQQKVKSKAVYKYKSDI